MKESDKNGESLQRSGLSDSLIVAVLTCGREEYLSETIDSWRTLSDISNYKKIMFDDSGDSSYRYELSLNYPDFEIVPISEKNVGVNFAYNIAFKYLKALDPSYVLWIEEDQKLLRKINIPEFLSILDRNKLLQLSTNRAPFFGAEIGYKNITEYLINNGWLLLQDNNFIKHQVMWANSPSIFIGDILDVDYPADLDTLTSEYRFGKLLLEKFPEYTFGFYGNINDEPYSEHFGKQSKNTINYYWREDE